MHSSLVLDCRRRVESFLAVVFSSWECLGWKKNGGSNCCFSPPVAEIGPVQEEGAVLTGDFLRLCLSMVGSQPKGQYVTLTRERAGLPSTPCILPRPRGNPAGPRGLPTASLWRAMVWWGQEDVSRGRRTLDDSLLYVWRPDVLGI